MKDFIEKLQNRLDKAEKVVFFGLGETKLSDDGVGPYIITELLKYSNEKFLFINAGIDPMSRIDDVTEFNPTHLVIIDTCTLEKPSGTVALIEREHISEYVPISTHTIPIHIVVDMIAEQIPDLNVFMIGIVPESLQGFTELKRYKEGELTLEEINQNEDLPFFDFILTDKIQRVADKLVKSIKNFVKNSST